jgi:hypothetical protein
LGKQNVQVPDLYQKLYWLREKKEEKEKGHSEKKDTSRFWSFIFWMIVFRLSTSAGESSSTTIKDKNFTGRKEKEEKKKL